MTLPQLAVQPVYACASDCGVAAVKRLWDSLLNDFRQNYLDKELQDYDITVLGIAPGVEAWLASIYACTSMCSVRSSKTASQAS